MHIAIRNNLYMDSNIVQMKPQDILLLLKIIGLKSESWKQLPIAEALGMSQSEVSEAVKRCKYAGLLDIKGKKVCEVLLEFFTFRDGKSPSEWSEPELAYVSINTMGSEYCHVSRNHPLSPGQ